jgi:hypothetical protein
VFGCVLLLDASLWDIVANYSSSVKFCVYNAGKVSLKCVM